MSSLKLAVLPSASRGFADGAADGERADGERRLSALFAGDLALDVEDADRFVSSSVVKVAMMKASPFPCRSLHGWRHDCLWENLGKAVLCISRLTPLSPLCFAWRQAVAALANCQVSAVKAFADPKPYLVNPRVAGGPDHPQSHPSGSLETKGHGQRERRLPHRGSACRRSPWHQKLLLQVVQGSAAGRTLSPESMAGPRA